MPGVPVPDSRTWEPTNLNRNPPAGAARPSRREWAKIAQGRGPRHAVCAYWGGRVERSATLGKASQQRVAPRRGAVNALWQPQVWTIGFGIATDKKP